MFRTSAVSLNESEPKNCYEAECERFRNKNRFINLKSPESRKDKTEHLLEQEKLNNYIKKNIPPKDCKTVHTFLGNDYDEFKKYFATFKTLFYYSNIFKLKSLFGDSCLKLYKETREYFYYKIRLDVFTKPPHKKMMLSNYLYVTDKIITVDEIAGVVFVSYDYEHKSDFLEKFSNIISQIGCRDFEDVLIKLYETDKSFYVNIVDRSYFIDGSGKKYF